MGSRKYNVECAVSTLEKLCNISILFYTKLHFVSHTVNRTWRNLSELSELPLAIVTAFSSSTACF